MIVLAVDPSSSRTGYALLLGVESIPQPELLEAGLLKPRRKADKSIVRAATMCDELEDLIANHTPHAVLVEVPSGRCGTGSKRGASSSLTIYGMAAGMLYRSACLAMGGLGGSIASSPPSGRDAVDRVHGIDERTWTRGFRRGRKGLSKQQRAELVSYTFAGYDAAARETDKGMDMADAIALGWWWLVSSPAEAMQPAAQGGGC